MLPLIWRFLPDFKRAMRLLSMNLLRIVYSVVNLCATSCRFSSSTTGTCKSARGNPHQGHDRIQESPMDRFIRISMGHGDSGLDADCFGAVGQLDAGTRRIGAIHHWSGRDPETFALGQEALFPPIETPSRIWPLGRLGFAAEQSAAQATFSRHQTRHHVPVPA